MFESCVTSAFMSMESIVKIDIDSIFYTPWQAKEMKDAWDKPRFMDFMNKAPRVWMRSTQTCFCLRSLRSKSLSPRLSRCFPCMDKAPCEREKVKQHKQRFDSREIVDDLCILMAYHHLPVGLNLCVLCDALEKLPCSASSLSRPTPQNNVQNVCNNFIRNRLTL